MTHQALSFLICFQILLSVGSLSAEVQSRSPDYVVDKSNLNSSSTLTNGCPYPLTGRLPKESEVTIAADGTTAPCLLNVRKARPLSPDTSQNRKWTEYNRAILDSDFNRLIILFTKCAETGDGLCQYLLAEGVSEWIGRTDVKTQPAFNHQFVRKWLRKAFRSDETLRLVSSSYAASFNNGYGGFPQDKKLSDCWFGVANAPKNSVRAKLRKMANRCEKHSIGKHGIKP